MSLFIALEGIDASGKHTQSERLRTFYEGKGLPVTKFEFPQYSSITGEMIRGHLVGDWRVEMSPEARVRLYDHMPVYMTDPSTYVFQCCQLINRMETLPDELWDAGQAGVEGAARKRIYIADRYNASAYAYGLAFGIDFDWLVHTHRRLPQPDLNIFLDITVEESFNRRPERRDNYERNAGLLDRVRECYLTVFKQLGPSYAVIDAGGTQEQTFERILSTISERVG